MRVLNLNRICIESQIYMYDIYVIDICYTHIIMHDVYNLWYIVYIVVRQKEIVVLVFFGSVCSDLRSAERIVGVG